MPEPLPTTDRRTAFVVPAGLIALGLVLGGYLLGDGLKRARLADRAVTVRGLAERDVVADLATWSIGYSATGNELAPMQAKIDADTAAIRAFLKGFGFADNEIATTSVAVNQWVDNNPNLPPERRNNVTIRQRLQLRTDKVMNARRAHAAQGELVRRGIVLEEGGSAMVYSFTRLNDVKPAMIAAATKNARAGAEQFAKDSGSDVAGIRSASQGYFSITARDGEEAGSGRDSPFQKVRVVTTIDFYLDD